MSPRRNPQQLNETAKAIDSDWICNVAAVEANNGRGLAPNPKQIQAAIDDPDKMLVEDGDSFAIFYEDNGERGGAYWRNACVVPKFLANGQANIAQMQQIYVRLANPAVQRWGYVWGRVTNELIREVMLGFPGCTQDPDDPEVLYFRQV